MTKTKLLIIIKCVSIIILIAYLFYNSAFTLIFGIPAFILLYRDECKKAEKQELERTEEIFKDVLQSVLTSLKAGYSVENAFVEAEKDLEYRLGKNNDMVLELLAMNRHIKNNIPIEKTVYNLAEATKSKDIMDFATVFKIARRTGGDMGKVLERTISIITRRRELKQEISLLVAAKKYEQQIMNCVPMGIIFYIRLTNPRYFDDLYHNLFGITVMTVALVVYYFAYRLSEKILDIA